MTVSSNIIRQLLERDWIRVVGHRDVPGRPAMFGTTRAFLDYFSLKKLDDLPPLADLSDWESLRVQLNLPEVENPGDSEAEDIAAVAANDVQALHPEGEDTSDISEAPEESAEPHEDIVAEKVSDPVG